MILINQIGKKRKMGKGKSKKRQNNEMKNDSRRVIEKEKKKHNIENL